MRDLELCNEIARIISDCIGAEDLDQEVAKIIMQKKEEIRFKIAVYIPIIIPPGNAEGAVKNSLIQLSDRLDASFGGTTILPEPRHGTWFGQDEPSCILTCDIQYLEWKELIDVLPDALKNLQHSLLQEEIGFKIYPAGEKFDDQDVHFFDAVKCGLLPRDWHKVRHNKWSAHTSKDEDQLLLEHLGWAARNTSPTPTIRVPDDELGVIEMTGVSPEDLFRALRRSKVDKAKHKEEKAEKKKEERARLEEISIIKEQIEKQDEEVKTLSSKLEEAEAANKAIPTSPLSCRELSNMLDQVARGEDTQKRLNNVIAILKLLVLNDEDSPLCTVLKARCHALLNESWEAIRVLERDIGVGTISLQDPMLAWHIGKTCQTVSRLWPETDPDTKLTTYPEPPDKHQIKWLEVAVINYGNIPDEHYKKTPSLWNKSLCLERLADLTQNADLLIDAMAILAEIPTSSKAPLDGRPLGHEARTNHAILTMKWASEILSQNEVELDDIDPLPSHYPENLIELIRKSIDGLLEIPQSSKEWLKSITILTDMAGMLMFTLVRQEEVEFSVETLELAIEKSQLIANPILGHWDHPSEASVWMRMVGNIAEISNVLVQHYIDENQPNRAKLLSEQVIQNLIKIEALMSNDNDFWDLDDDARPKIESEFSDVYFSRARMAHNYNGEEGRPDIELNESDELRLFLKWTDALLDINTIGESMSENRYKWILERRIRFGLRLLHIFNSNEYNPDNLDYFQSEVEALEKRMINQELIEQFGDDYPEQLRNAATSYRLMGALYLLKQEDPQEDEIIPQMNDLITSIEGIETKISAFMTAVLASAGHDSLYDIEDLEDPVFDEDLSEILDFSVRQLRPEVRRAAAQLLAATICLSLEFEDHPDWSVPPFQTSTGEERHPFLRPLITDMMLTYTALGYQDSYDFLDATYDIPELLLEFSESEELEVICKELDASLEAGEPESHATDILDHNNCRSICSIYLSWRDKGLVHELPKLEEYMSLDKSYQKLRESIFADESEDSE
tara:strand:- start:4948 stop:8007 length:3060 start_codon:yes stop_codon:yes gene_type:complete